MIRVLSAAYRPGFVQVILQNRFIRLIIHFQGGKVPVSKQFDQILTINEMKNLLVSGSCSCTNEYLCQRLVGI